MPATMCAPFHRRAFFICRAGCVISPPPTYPPSSISITLHRRQEQQEKQHRHSPVPQDLNWGKIFQACHQIIAFCFVAWSYFKDVLNFWPLGLEKVVEHLTEQTNQRIRNCVGLLDSFRLYSSAEENEIMQWIKHRWPIVYSKCCNLHWEAENYGKDLSIEIYLNYMR